MIIVNIAEKINTLKLLADEEKGLIKALTIQLIILNLMYLWIHLLLQLTHVKI